jgi:hypothetical protein
MVSTTLRPLYPRERPGTHCTRGWVGPRAGLDVCEKSHPTGIFLSKLYYMSVFVQSTPVPSDKTLTTRERLPFYLSLLLFSVFPPPHISRCYVGPPLTLASCILQSHVAKRISPSIETIHVLPFRPREHWLQLAGRGYPVMLSSIARAILWLRLHLYGCSTTQR